MQAFSLDTSKLECTCSQFQIQFATNSFRSKWQQKNVFHQCVVLYSTFTASRFRFLFSTTKISGQYMKKSILISLVKITWFWFHYRYVCIKFSCRNNWSEWFPARASILKLLTSPLLINIPFRSSSKRFLTISKGFELCETGVVCDVSPIEIDIKTQYLGISGVKKISLVVCRVYWNGESSSYWKNEIAIQCNKWKNSIFMKSLEYVADNDTSVHKNIV